MQKKSFFRLGLVALALGISFVILRAARPSPSPAPVCKKTKAPCPVRQIQAPSGLFLETLGRQFFTSVLFSY
jgi:hypothetical protein